MLFDQPVRLTLHLYQHRDGNLGGTIWIKPATKQKVNAVMMHAGDSIDIPTDAAIEEIKSILSRGLAVSLRYNNWRSAGRVLGFFATHAYRQTTEAEVA